MNAPKSPRPRPSTKSGGGKTAEKTSQTPQQPASTPVQPANVKPANDPAPSSSNTCGKICPQTSPQSPAAKPPEKAKPRTKAERDNDIAKYEQERKDALKRGDKKAAEEADLKIAQVMDEPKTLGDVAGEVGGILSLFMGGRGRGRGKTKPQAPAMPPPTQPASGSGGVYSVGSGGDPSRCKLRPYSEIKDECAKKGMDAHHVTPNRTFQTSTRRANKMMKGGVPEGDGLSICLETNKNGLEAEHTRAHKYYDEAEKRLAKDPESPEGLALLGQVEAEAADAIEKATKGQCSKKEIQDQLRDHHQKKYKLKPDTQVRATKNPNQMSADTKSKMGTRRGRR